MVSFLKLAYVTAVLAVAGMITSAASDGLGMWRSLGDFLQSIQRQERLEAEEHRLTESQKRMESILSQLVDGRISLHEAAAALRDAYLRRSSNVRLRFEDYWGKAGDARLLRWTLMLAESRLTGETRERVLQRLQAELHSSVMDRHEAAENPL